MIPLVGYVISFYNPQLLTITPERSFQIPFTYMLQDDGYNVVHVSRHCGMEIGKDIIAIDKDGRTCVFQLKTAPNGKISLSDWQKINGQIYEAITTKVIHPSIKSTKQHKTYLVTNGELEEETTRAIDDLNRRFTDRGDNDSVLHVILKSYMLQKAKELGHKLWPTKLKETRLFLELYLLDGNSNIPKSKLSNMFKSILFDNLPKKFSTPEKYRRISSCALLCSIISNPFYNNHNHNSVIEAWLICLSYIHAFAEKYSLDLKAIAGTSETILNIVYNSFHDLCKELMELTYFVQGEPLSDKLVYRIRMTKLVSLMSVYYLWRRHENVPEDDEDIFIQNFCMAKHNQMQLWGEAAVPQFLAFFWFYSEYDATNKPENYLLRITHIISTVNARESNNPLPNPYYLEDSVLPHVLFLTDDKYDEDFSGVSYTIESLIHILARRLRKQALIYLWPSISTLCFNKFVQSNTWQYYLWHTEDGKNYSEILKRPTDWDDFKKEASNLDFSHLPSYLKSNVILFILFLIVYPHRLRSDAVRYIDYSLNDI